MLRLRHLQDLQSLDHFQQCGSGLKRCSRYSFAYSYAVASAATSLETEAPSASILACAIA